MTVEFTTTQLTAMRDVASSYRILRDADYGPLVPPSRRPGFRQLVELTNYYSALLGTTMPLMGDGEIDTLFRRAKHSEFRISDDNTDQEAFVELLGVLNSRRQLRNGV